MFRVISSEVAVRVLTMAQMVLCFVCNTPYRRHEHIGLGQQLLQLCSRSTTPRCQ